MTTCTRAGVAVALSLAVAAACGEDLGTAALRPKVVSAYVVPAVVTLAPGQTQTFAAYGLTADGQRVTAPVTWSAVGGTITQDGVFTADTVAGAFRVTAMSETWGLAGVGSVIIAGHRPPRRVASVDVRPDTASLPVDARWPFTAIPLDSAGDSLSGRPITWTSSDQSVATVDSSGLVTAVAPGTATITAVSEGRTGTGGITVLPPGTGPWPHEPAGFTVISDQPWNLLSAFDWYLEFGTASIGVDPTAPLSPPNVLQIVYPIGFEGGSAPGTMSRELGAVRRLYVGLLLKVSDPWQGHPTNVNKIAFLFSESASGDIYLAMYGSPGGPYELKVNPQFRGVPGAGTFLEPNVARAPLTLGKWHRIEWLLVYNTTTEPPNGIVRWWFDGQLVGDYYNVQFPSLPLVAFKLSPTWGGTGSTKTETDYYWYDHVHISGR